MRGKEGRTDSFESDKDLSRHSEPRLKNPSEAKGRNLLIFLMTDGFKWLIDTQERTEEAPGGWQESVPIAAAQLYTPR
jgi:hypothetical protein